MKRNTGFLMACMMLLAAAIAGGRAISTAAAPVSVYCFFNASEKDSFWTTSWDEKNALANSPNGLYRYNGDGFQVDTQAGGGRVPIYRFYNDTTKDHFFTTSDQEKRAVEENTRTGRDNYVYEGIAGYAYTGGSWPVYRFFDEDNFNHYYTASESEKTSLLSGSARFRFEGIGWYACGLGSNGGSGNGSAGVSALTKGTSSGGSSSGSSNAQAKSDEEIVRLLGQKLGEQNDPYGGFGVWQYGHRAEKYYYYSSRQQRQPSSRELWCFVGKSQGEGAIPIANVYVDIYTGTAVFDFVETSEGFVEPSFPSRMQLW